MKNFISEKNELHNSNIVSKKRNKWKKNINDVLINAGDKAQWKLCNSFIKNMKGKKCDNLIKEGVKNLLSFESILFLILFL